MNIGIILLAIVALISLIAALLVTLGFSIPCIETDTLPAVAISSGVLIATLTFVRERKKQETESELKKDEVNIEVIANSFNEVYELLKDMNNSRVIWIRAARVLLWAKELGETITNEAMKKSYELQKERLRTRLYLLMQRKPENNEQYESESLPGQFFYGIPNWEDRSITIDEAAIASHPNNAQAHRVSLSTVVPSPKSSELDVSSVVAIFDFIRESDLLENDPLEGVKIWEGEPASFDIFQGPANYVAHKNKYRVVNGELKEKNG